MKNLDKRLAALESNSSTQQRDTFAEHEAAFIAGLTDEQLAQHLVALTQVLAECESPKIMALVETCTLQSVC